MIYRISPQRVLGAIALLSLLSLQCQSEKLESDTDPTPTEMQDDFAASECATCLESECSAEVDGCTGQPACGSAYDCLGACSVSEVIGGADCAAACADGSDQAFSDLRGCLQASSQGCCAEPGPSPGAGGTSGGSGGASGNEAPECQPAAGDTACVACAKQNCCESRAACIAEPQCLPYEACWIACVQENTGDEVAIAQCVQACETTAPGGLAPQRALTVCVQRDCLAPCGIASTPAVDCFLAECPESYVGCFGDAECWRLQLCVLECAGSQPCAEACLEQFPAAADAHDAFVLCANNNCADVVQGI
jgi:hypothetical protein